MSRERTPFYEKTSPNKSPNLTYARKYETLESTKQTRNNPSFLNESKENIPSSLAGGMRDVLLLKCKQAIEELHLELEGEKKLRIQVEEALNEAENEAHDKDSQLREARYRLEKQQDEIRTIRTQNDNLRKELEHAEDQIRVYNSKNSAQTELQRNFESVCEANNILKEKIAELSLELENRDMVARQWHDTLGSIHDKIMNLEKENNELKDQYQMAVDENSKLQRLLEDSQNAANVWKDKYESVERFSGQLQKENKILDNLREQNENLRKQIQEYQRNLATVQEENRLNIARMEEKFTKEKEDLEDSLKENHRKKMIEQQAAFDADIMRVKESNENLRTDYFRAKNEKEALKQEISMLNERLETIELEGKKMNGNIASNFEIRLKNKNDEIETLKGVIEDQGKLIASYEKMLEKERNENAARAAGLSDNNTRLREETLELRTKNEHLSNKLKETQSELAALTNEVHITFKEEEDKQTQLKRKLADLEAELVDRNTLVNTLSSQLENLKALEKRQAEEIENTMKSNREVTDELAQAKKQMIELYNENEELREKQKEFYDILQGKINIISEELKQERERRIQAQNLCKTHEEHIIELEAAVRSYKKIMASKAERVAPRPPSDLSDPATWAQMRNYATVEVSQRQEVPAKTYQSGRDSKPQDRGQGSQRTENRDSVKRSRKDYSFERSREIEEEIPQRLEDAKDNFKALEQGSPERIHFNFINRFKTVIEKLENKLESITADIESSN